MNHDLPGNEVPASLGENISHEAQTEPGRAAAPEGLPVSSWGKKTMLLVDLNARTREARAKTFRTLGVAVECASTAAAARAHLAAGGFDLVLMDFGRDTAGAESLAREMKSTRPKQRIGFLVGSPRFVVTSLSGITAPRRPVVPRPPEAPAVAVSAPPAAGLDFGQRVKNAEAEAKAEAAAKQ